MEQILNKLKFGDLIELKQKNNITHFGTFLSIKNGNVQIKLENGYNIGISKKNIKSIIIKKRKTIKTEKQLKKPLDSKKPLIWILHTGGTIASRVDYNTGAVHPLFNPEDLISMFPELNEIAQIKTKLLFNILSEDMNFEQYNIISKEIFKLVKTEKNLKGIIIPHGTDTLHYSSSALSFILENLNVPVILVGSQRSSDRGSSDSYENLMNAAHFIINSKYKGVAICMHETSDDENALILPPHNTRKMHTSRRDAFKPINQNSIARVNFKKGMIKYLSKIQYKKFTKNLTIKPFNTKLKIGIIKSRPNFPNLELSFYKDYDGLILEGTGLGHFNLSNINTEFKKLTMPVVMTPQCIYGRINLNVYSRGRELTNMGILGNLNAMTTETAYIKLAWLLSNFDKKDVPKLISTNFRGEMIERIEQNTF